jgi:hypothetical protein
MSQPSLCLGQLVVPAKLHRPSDAWLLHWGRLEEAARRGTSPTWSAASTMAPLSSSSRATSRWPHKHAFIRAVIPSYRVHHQQAVTQGGTV